MSSLRHKLNIQKKGLPKLASKWCGASKALVLWPFSAPAAGEGLFLFVSKAVIT
jgi:hypothetical protein